MTANLFLKRTSICLVIIYTIFAFPACHKNNNPAPKAPAPVATDKWTKLSVTNDAINTLEVVNNTIYAGAGTTLYISADQGATWTSSKLTARDLTYITAIKVFNNTIYAGTNISGIFSSVNGGKTWVNNNASYFQSTISSFADRDNKLYAGTGGDGVFVLKPATNDWQPFNNNLPQAFTSYDVFKIVNTGNTLVAAAGVNSTFYRYDFNNNQWVDSMLPKHGSYLSDMIYDKGAIIGIGTERKILRSENNGVDWTYDTKDLQETLPGALNNEKIYAGSINYYVLINTIEGGWVQQRDKTAAVGSSWANGQELLSKIQLAGIVELNNKIFLATNNGLYIKKL